MFTLLSSDQQSQISSVVTELWYKTKLDSASFFISIKSGASNQQLVPKKGACLHGKRLPLRTVWYPVSFLMAPQTSLLGPHSSELK